MRSPIRLIRVDLPQLFQKCGAKGSGVVTLVRKQARLLPQTRDIRKRLAIGSQTCFLLARFNGKENLCPRSACSNAFLLDA